MNIAVLGSAAFTLGFRLAGIRHVSETPSDIRALLRDPELGIVVTDTHTIEQLDEHTKEDALRSIKPVVVVVSDKPQEELRQMIIRSIGVDLMKGDHS